MNEGMHSVTGGHALWWSSGGAHSGTPVCIVHGGPGGRSRAESAQWFAQAHAQWLMFDQRGAGRSSYSLALSHNTMADLVQDMETLRVMRGYERWVLCGGSWGALVAVRYALAYPERVLGLMLRSPFLGTPREISGFFERMPPWLGQEARELLGIALQANGTQVLQKFTHLLLSPDSPEYAAVIAAYVWEAFENDLGESVSTKLPGLLSTPSARLVQVLAQRQQLRSSPAVLHKFRLQAHYLSQACFLENDWAEQLQQGFHKLGHVPVEIVQGDSDLVCPPFAADQLLKSFSRAAITWVPGAGHDMSSPAMREALTQTASRLIARVQQINNVNNGVKS
jgi:proline iminopeptidase